MYLLLDKNTKIVHNKIYIVQYNPKESDMQKIFVFEGDSSVVKNWVWKSLNESGFALTTIKEESVGGLNRISSENHLTELLIEAGLKLNRINYRIEENTQEPKRYFGQTVYEDAARWP